MKTKLFLLIVVLISSMVFIGCKNDDDEFVPNDKVQKEFQTRYPNAKDLTWETENGYIVAKFRQGSEYSEAWFIENALWIMTNTSIKFPSLPQAVQDSYNGSYYADWTIDGIMRLERIDTKMLFVIEVDRDPYTLDLQYSASGILINAIPHQDDEFYLPVTIPIRIKDFISATYPAAEIMQYSKIGYNYVADILEGVTPMHVNFDKDYNWLYTTWEVYYINVPQPIQNKITTAYPGYKVLTTTQKEDSKGTTYIIRMVNMKKEIEVTFDPEGNVINETSPQ